MPCSSRAAQIRLIWWSARSSRNSSIAYGTTRVYLGPSWLEEFDRVAGRVLEENLPSARAAEYVVAERQSRRPEPGHLRLDVGHDEVDPVPPARRGHPAVRHRPTRGALRSGQQQAQVAALHIGEGRQELRVQLEAEVGGVEVD